MGFGENLCKARKIKGLSQEDVAGSLNVSRQSVSFWENNQTVPSLDNLMAICDLLEVNSAILLGQEEFPDEKRERERLRIENEKKQRAEEEAKKREEAKKLRDYKEFKKNNLISFIFALASILLVFIPFLGLAFPIISLGFAVTARKYRHDNMNLFSFVFSIVYIAAGICFFVYIVG